MNHPRSVSTQLGPRHYYSQPWFPTGNQGNKGAGMRPTMQSEPRNYSPTKPGYPPYSSEDRVSPFQSGDPRHDPNNPGPRGYMQNPSQAYRSEPPFQQIHPRGNATGMYPHYGPISHVQPPIRSPPDQHVHNDPSRYAYNNVDNPMQSVPPNFYQPAVDINGSHPQHYPQYPPEYQGYLREEMISENPTIHIQTYVTLNRDNEDVTGIFVIPQSRSNADPESNKPSNYHEAYSPRGVARYPGSRPSYQPMSNPQPWSTGARQRYW